ncbi:rhomboid family intramembrane serine protease [Paenimyroides baculatum]|uniref:Rhomboid family intramembrane serine protease n=1 Tax=Paenimyroides baculatum TaxID=2608000 RepID=A0A5M6CNG5_9FLAO|nr:rhomboid family intramembrane serine protease [Paenimyroides baculatum]KAA5535930.1 rhomboid family intramembrane serine protease [Paenimyroides baculatum]
MNQITPVVKQLLIVNVIIFLAANFFMPILKDYLPLYYFENPAFQFWQPITHMFMHGSIPHILFNMFALYSFGSVLEQIWGGKKFVLFYILCGLGAAILHTAVNYWQFHDGLNTLLLNGIKENEVIQTLNQSMINNGWQQFLSPSKLDSFASSYLSVAVGASGAIYGLLVAFAFMFPNAGLALLFIPVPIKAKYFVPGVLVLDLVLGFNGAAIFGSGGTGIAHFAHIGGALVGFLLMWFWKKKQFDQFRWDK